MLQGIWRGALGSRHDSPCEAVRNSHLDLLAYLRHHRQYMHNQPGFLCYYHLCIQLQCQRQSSHALPPPNAGLHHHQEGWATCITGRAPMLAASRLLGKPSPSRNTAVRLQHTASHHVRHQAADLAVCTRNTAARSACDGKPK